MDNEVSGSLGALNSSHSSRPTPSSLLDLHDDILVQILQDVQSEGTLRALALTCRDIRTLCMPLLFSQCTVTSRTPVAYAFLPNTVWPYIKHLVLIDKCADIVAEDMEVPLQFAQDPMLCGIYDGPRLENALRNMPQLSSVAFKIPGVEIHGLPWSVIAAVLSVPGLQELRIISLLICPKTLPTETIGLHHPVPLKSFDYALYDLRSEPRSWPTEKQALINILVNVCSTLEKLTIPTEAVPFRYLLSAQFPALRELHLRGDYRTAGSPPLPYVQAFANMPRLRCLDLRLAQVFDDHIPPLWPAGLETTFPWPELEHLTISHPVVEDRIYANLPPFLRSLSLRSFPHLSTSVWKLGIQRHEENRWGKFVLLTASQVQSILWQLQLPSLERLELEYQEDDADEDLLQYIISTFHTLVAITIRRYRRKDSPGVPVVDIARKLATLPRLRTVRLHLDVSGTPSERMPVGLFDSKELFGPRQFGPGSQRLEYRVVRDASGVHVQHLPLRWS
ncbi:hypothetical protein C8Q79DRAFT_977412 [Trametes meyenii]|nr:hypothetical protein C8Q79DRAFT_977412 [Trametes meyenii]